LRFPPIFSQWRGEAQSRGEREIRDEVRFQANQGSTEKQRSCDEPESLPSRIYRTLDGVPRNGKWEGGTQNVYRVVISCDRVSRKILIAGIEPGRLGSSR
jgi:hypothetical protein